MFVGLQDGLYLFASVETVFVPACVPVPASAPACLTQDVLESV